MRLNVRLSRVAVTVASFVVVAGGFASSATAQDRSGQRPGQGRGGGRSMPSMLRAGSPEVGDQLPSVSIFTDDGTPIQTHHLEGKFKVIVFGCLT